MAEPKRVALALGSGGARGYAHIGAIQAVTGRGLEIVGIAGSSMGALVGGLYAAGKLDEYTDWALTLTQLDVVRLLDVSVTSAGAIRAEKVLARVREILGDVQIEDLPLPFTAVATDLAAGRPVWFQRGPLDVAIRASIAIPGVITPAVLNGRVLIDGGTLAPLPVAPTVALASDLTIGISLSGEERGLASPVNVSAEPRPVEEWIGRFRRSAGFLLERDIVRSVVGRFGSARAHTDSGPADSGNGAYSEITADSDAAADEEVFEPPVDPALEAAAVASGGVAAPKLGRVAVMSRSIDIMQSVLARHQLAAYPPDVLVEIPRSACRSLDFHKAAEMIELGRTLTEAALDNAGFLEARAGGEHGPPQPGDHGPAEGSPE
ncbi:patatin-like phospholipase family protein [Rhodococcus sp. HM1]|uniref:patatin-like phospholipase family protein n=1 Tax=Rhodococcus sp. HM1 TaxID=2937759 RepID=UPI00200B4245|nr:patatin-like phospholipase family protein [Rhodococcus sp. HM1]MCK8669741.1 patatin-like phospholipase family protein [Rhodococcus sp. HM1]